MGRLTTDKKVNEMSMVELAHNCCYAKDRTARYRDYDTDIDAREIAKRLMVAYGQWQVDGLDTDTEIIDDDIFDESIMENLMYDPDIIVGLIALFYRNLWAMADLREKLKAYEDIIDDPEKLKLIDEIYLERCEEINRLNKELAEYKKLEEEGLILRLRAKIGDEVYEINKLTRNIASRTITNILICNSTDLTIFYRCNNYSIIDRAFGETVFLTQEEAEQALADMKGK